MIYETLREQLTDLSRLLGKMKPDDYQFRSSMLGDTSIGQHVRHVIELAQCLLQGYGEGIVNYDDRKRDRQLETDKDLAVHWLQVISEEVAREDKALGLVQGADGNQRLETYYFRELAYNTEHAIHHMALIRVALREMELSLVDEGFGVAPSTIRYRKNS